MNSLISSAISALDTFSVGWQAIANNVANMNTDGFQGSRVRYQDLPNGQGVGVGEVRTDTSAGAPTEPRPDEVLVLTQTRAEAANAEAVAQAAADARAAEYRESSNVQIEREFTEAIALEHAYAANAHVVSTYDDMMGTVIDMIV